MTLGFGRSSADLTAVVAVLAATALAVLLNWPPMVRVPLALSSVFVVPGYALGIALFPAGESSLARGERTRRSEGLSLLDRAVLCVGTSLSVVVLVGILVNLSPVPLSTESLLGGLVTVTAAVVPIAYHRRRAVPVADRFAPFALRSPGTADAGSRSRRQAVLRVLVALSVVLAGGAVTYSTVMADGDSSVTEFYLLTESEDGELRAADYPTNLTTDDTEELTLAVGNRNDARGSYAVIGQLQRVERGDDGVVVHERRRIYSGQLTVPAGETATLETTVTPHEPGQHRLVYLLYTDDPPEQPRMDTAHREIHLWIDVEEPTDETAS